jgi:hypothetical protein
VKLNNPLLQFLNWFPHQQFSFLACAVFIVGLIAGRAVMSIGMMMLLGNAVVNLKVKETFKELLNNKAGLLLAGLFLLYAFSFFWSADKNYYASRIQLMSPFFVMPFAMQSIKWERKYFEYLLFLFVVVCVGGAIWSLAQYAEHKELIDISYGYSKSMPTPFKRDHIRFGVGVVMAISFCFQFLKTSFRFKWLIWVVVAFLFAYLHLLASKTALLSLYLISLYEIILLVKSKKYRLFGLSSLLILFILPFVFFYTSQSFRNKFFYTKYSFDQLFNEKSETNISDEGRIVAFKTALRVYSDNWLIGVGAGDGFNVMKKAYSEAGIYTKKTLYPHNQFLYIALILGSVGLLYFLYLYGFLFFEYFKKSHWLGSFLLLFFVPFMVEAFFNTQYGIALFVFFFLLLDRMEKSKMQLFKAKV